MTRDELIDEALRLKTTDREFLVRRLIASLVESVEPPLDDVWYEQWIPEIRRRQEEIGSGRVNPLSWEEVQVRLQELVAPKSDS